MTDFEKQCITRVYHAALGIIDRRSITKAEIDITMEVLKKCADQRNDWTDQLKEEYKIIADYAKENIKRNING